MTDDYSHDKSAPPAREKGALTGTVLVVDDSKLNADLLRGQLEQLGLVAEAVCTGQAAVEYWKLKQFDCVLMDLQMPGMDGFETTRQLRNLEDRRHIPIIAMTAGATSESRRHCLDAGLDDYLSKPVSSLILRQTLAKWLPAGEQR
jgi:CheY-like chemotaxis protein